MPVTVRSTNLLSCESSHLLVVDVQEKLIPVIPKHEQITAEIDLLLNAASVLNIPVTLSEQYPAGLGVTVSAIGQHDAIQHRFEKLKFSAADEFLNAQPEAIANASENQRQVVLVGIETHICILQTAFDLQQAGWKVFVVANSVGSRRQVDHDCGLSRMSAAGITIVTTESVLFEWCEAAGTDLFRQISRLVRSHQPME